MTATSPQSRGAAAYGGPLASTASGLTVARAFRQAARRYAEQPALQQGSHRISYRELDARANRLANALAALGVHAGDRVAILSENRTEYVELQLAGARLGIIIACQNWRMAPSELLHCLSLIGPKATFVSERYSANLAALDCDKGEGITFGPAYEAMLAAARDSELPDVAHPEDGLVILYTSGTTGLPKAAVISQRAMIARGMIGELDGILRPGTTFIAWAPMFHMVSTDNALATLMRGGKVIVIDGFDPDAIVRACDGEDIGWLQLMPGTVEQAVAAFKSSNVRPRRLGSVGCMADLVPRQQIAEITDLLQAPFINSFGSTETGSPPASKNLIPIGVVQERLPKEQNSMCDIRLVDPDNNDVPDGQPGELAFRGPSLFSGYWQIPEQQDFHHGWFHMGDVFHRNPDGTLEFVDRRKYLIKSGGENIYPAEIERVLLMSSRIADAVVVRQQDERWGEVPVAFVVANDPALTPDDVVGLCRGKIANYKLPKAVRFVADADLPRSTTGKVKRHELEQVLTAERITQAPAAS
jgi:fatty-acyl-CoA synthase